MKIEESQRADWIRSAVSRFSGPLLRYAQSITGNVDQARDVVQDTFIRLCDENPEQILPRLTPWLYTVCRNRALDVQRRQYRTRPLEPAELDLQVSPEPSPAVQAERNDTHREILALLARLPKNQSEVVRLKFQHGLSYREVSAITQLSETNVGFLIHTALKTLRQQMKADLAVSEGRVPASPISNKEQGLAGARPSDSTQGVP
jgi:RNA polymerase sigma-70 factor (ECF subfamily)